MVLQMNSSYYVNLYATNAALRAPARLIIYGGFYYLGGLGASTILGE